MSAEELLGKTGTLIENGGESVTYGIRYDPIQVRYIYKIVRLPVTWRFSG